MKIINRRLLTLIATTLAITNIHLLHAQQPKPPSSPAQKKILFTTQKIVAKAERQAPKIATPEFIKKTFEAQRDETMRADLRIVAKSGTVEQFNAVFTAVLGKKPSELSKEEVLRYLRIKDTANNISALQSAAANVNLEFIKLVFAYCDSAVTPEDKNEMLKQAVGRDYNNDQQDECIKFLIEEGADIQAIITYFTNQLENDPSKIIQAFRIANVARRLNKQYVLVKDESLADWVNKPGRALALAQAADKTTPIDPGIVYLFAALDAVSKAPKKPETFGIDALKIHVQKDAQICCMGDIHGSLGALLRNLQKLQAIGFFDANFKIKDDKNYIVFTGDYINRGMHNIGVVYTLMLLVIGNPGRVVLLQGNHELSWFYAPRIDLGQTFQTNLAKMLERAGIAKDTIEGMQTSVSQIFDRNFFHKLPVVLFIGAKEGDKDIWLQCCHGGVEPFYDHREFLNKAFGPNEFYQQATEIYPANLYQAKLKLIPPLGQWKDNEQAITSQDVTNFKQKQAEHPPLSPRGFAGYIWSEFCDGEGSAGASIDNSGYNPDATAVSQLTKTWKFHAGIKTGAHIAHDVATALGIVGWIRGHQHDFCGLKIGGETNWRDCLQEKATLDARTHLLTFKFADAKIKKQDGSTVLCPVFTLSTASEADLNPTAPVWNEPYDSFIILDTSADKHDDWVIKVHEAKVPADSPFWAPATTRNAAALKPVTAAEKESAEAATKQVAEDFKLAKTIRMIAGDGNAEKDDESLAKFNAAVTSSDRARVARCIDMLLEKKAGIISQDSNGVPAISSAIAHNKPKLTAAFLGYPLAERTKTMALAQCIASDFSFDIINLLIQKDASILSAISYRLKVEEKDAYLQAFCTKVKATGKDVIIDRTQKEPQAPPQDVITTLAGTIRATPDTEDAPKDDTMIRLLAEKNVDGLIMIKELSTDPNTQSFCEKIINLGGRIGKKEKPAAVAKSTTAAPAKASTQPVPPTTPSTTAATTQKAASVPTPIATTAAPTPVTAPAKAPTPVAAQTTATAAPTKPIPASVAPAPVPVPTAPTPVAAPAPIPAASPERPTTPTMLDPLASLVLPAQYEPARPRSTTPKTKRCDMCQAMNNKDALFCDECGSTEMSDVSKKPQSGEEEKKSTPQVSQTRQEAIAEILKISADFPNAAAIGESLLTGSEERVSTMICKLLLNDAKQHKQSELLFEICISRATPPFKAIIESFNWLNDEHIQKILKIARLAESLLQQQEKIKLQTDDKLNADVSFAIENYGKKTSASGGKIYTDDFIKMQISFIHNQEYREALTKKLEDAKRAHEKVAVMPATFGK